MDGELNQTATYYEFGDYWTNSTGNLIFSETGELLIYYRFYYGKE